MPHTPRFPAHLLGDGAAKEVAGATRADSPAVNVLGVGPHQIAVGALVRDLLCPVDGPDLASKQAKPSKAKPSKAKQSQAKQAKQAERKERQKERDRQSNREIERN